MLHLFFEKEIAISSALVFHNSEFERRSSIVNIWLKYLRRGKLVFQSLVIPPAIIFRLWRTTFSPSSFLSVFPFLVLRLLASSCLREFGPPGLQEKSPFTYLLRCNSWIRQYISFLSWQKSYLQFPLTLWSMHYLPGSCLSPLLLELRVQGHHASG